MKYIFILIILFPFKLLLQIIRLFITHNNKKNLVIHTAKIGDFINITPLLRYLKKSDAVLSKVVAPLLPEYDFLDQCFYIEDYNRNILHILKLIFILINRYENIYLLTPNNLNLFLSSLCNAKNKQFLSTYKRSWYQLLFYMTSSRVVLHYYSILALESYLCLGNRYLSYRDYSKYVRINNKISLNVKNIIKNIDTNRISIGISIASSNKIKIIPSFLWYELFILLKDIPCTYYIFGTLEEVIYFQKLYDYINANNYKNIKIVNLVGKTLLSEVPNIIQKMHCYISSDTGNIYIADALDVPVIFFAGLCEMREQRPLFNVLIISSLFIASSFVFNTKNKIFYSYNKIFNISLHDRVLIYNFIYSIYKKYLTSQNKILLKV